MLDLVLAVELVLAGIVAALALAIIGYVSGRKGMADELDERGFVGRKGRGTHVKP